MLKQGFEHSEGAAYWMKQKTENALTGTRVDMKLRELDAIAANTVTRLDDAQSTVSRISMFHYN